MLNKSTKFLLSLVIALFLCSTGEAATTYATDLMITKTDGIWTDSRAFTSIGAAVTNIGALERDLYIAKEESVTDLTIPANIRLHFLKTGAINNSGQLTINTTQITAKDQQIFTGTGDIDFASGTVVRSTWFSDFDEAVDVTSDDTLTLIVAENDTVDTNLTLGVDVTLKWNSPFIISSSTGFTFRNIKKIEAGSYQIFAGDGDFDFVAGIVLKSSWFPSLYYASVVTSDENANLTILVDQPETISLDTTFDSYQTVEVKKGCLINRGAGTTTTMSGGLSAGVYQIFTGTGSVLINGTVYPQWFGGFGDGTTHVETAFQEAVDACQGAYGEGGKIKIPYGAYLFYDEVIIRDDLVIEGEGHPELYMKTANKDLFVTVAQESEVVFRGLKFVGLGSDYDGTIDEAAIALRSGDVYIIVENCSFVKNEVGVDLYYDTTSSIISNCNFYQFSTAAIRGTRAHYVHINNNLVSGLRTGVGDEAEGRVGIWILSGSSTNSGKEVIITGNRVNNTSLEGIICRSERSIVSNNTVAGAGTTVALGGAGTSSGIIVEGTSGAVDLGGGVQVIVSDNIVYDSDAGIAVRFDPANPSTSAHDIIISNNIIRNMTSTTVSAMIASQGGGTVFGVRFNITGNLVYNVLHTGISTGNLQDSIVSGNLVDTAVDGIYVHGDDAHDVSIIGNVVRNTVDSGIVVAGVTSAIPRVQILSNVVENPNTDDSASEYGIHLTGNTEDCVVNSNVVDANSHVDYCIYMKGTEHVVGENVCRDYNTAAIFSNAVDTAAHIETIACTIAYEEPTSFDTTLGAMAVTLSDGFYIGQIKTIVMTVDGGDVTLTVTNGADYTFDDAEDYVVLVWNGYDWLPILDGT